MEDDDRLSQASFGSVISLESFNDSTSIQDKPKHGKKRTSSDQSPYTMRQFAGRAHGGSLGKSTGHDAWSAAIRNGFTGVSSESSSNKWAHSRAKPKKNKVPSYDKSGIKSQNGAFSRDEHILASGKPAYKSPEDYYDEVMELRQVIKELKADNGVVKTKLQRITQENVLKDRQIKDFLNPNKQPDEIRRTLTDRKADSSAVVSSLKQKLHLMERNVKDKENELRKVKSDMKSTNIEELKIQVETYYEETQRLQSVTRALTESSFKSSLSNSMSSQMNSPGRGNVGLVDQERLEKILDEKRRLESENKALKKDLLSSMESHHKSEKSSKSKIVDYADMNRLQMLRKIGELEELLEDSNMNVKNISKKDKKDNESTTIREKNESEELEKQRLTIENLKRDRSHYRDEAEKLRLSLQGAHEELEQVREDLKKAKEREPSEHITTPPRPLPRTRNKTGVMKKSISFQTLDKKPSNFKKDEEQAARTIQKHWRHHNEQKATSQDKDYSMAVVQIQSLLRGHTVRKQRIGELSETRDEEVDEHELEWEDAVTRIQSALRAHRARRKYSLNSEKSENARNHRHDPENDHSVASSDDDREHHRKPVWESTTFNKPDRHSSGQETSSASRYLNKLIDKHDDDDDDDDDDDVVIGGSRQRLRERQQRPIRTHGEPTSLKTPLNNTEMPSKFRKTSPTSKTTRSQNGFSFAKSDSQKRRETEEKKTPFFGRQDDKEQTGVDNTSSLDMLFSPSRSAKQPLDRRPGNEEENEDDFVTSSKKTQEKTENKEKKSIFSWGGSKKKPSQDIAKSPRKQKPSDKKENSKPTSVWSSRPSESIDDDDDDDDVVVTPKLAPRNQTKTASLLDELF